MHHTAAVVVCHCSSVQCVTRSATQQWTARRGPGNGAAVVDRRLASELPVSRRRAGAVQSRRRGTQRTWSAEQWDLVLVLLAAGAGTLLGRHGSLCSRPGHNTMWAPVVSRSLPPVQRASRQETVFVGVPFPNNQQSELRATLVWRQARGDLLDRRSWHRTTARASSEDICRRSSLTPAPLSSVRCRLRDSDSSRPPASAAARGVDARVVTLAGAALLHRATRHNAGRDEEWFPLAGAQHHGALLVARSQV